MGQRYRGKFFSSVTTVTLMEKILFVEIKNLFNYFFV